MSSAIPSYQPTTPTAVAVDIAATVPVRRRHSGGGTHSLTIAGERPWGRPNEAPLEWPGWMDEGLCHDPKRWDVFVPTGKGGRVGVAPAECGSCPVARQCLAQGIKTGSDGWWGGEYLHSGRSVTAAAEAKARRQRERERSRPPRVRNKAANAAIAAKLEPLCRPLYEAGLVDSEIAAAINDGTHYHTVGLWRRHNCLPNNNPAHHRRAGGGPGAHPKKATPTPTDSPTSELEIAA